MDQLISDEVATQAALSYSKQNLARLGGLCSALRSVDRDGIAGDFVECGVFKGSSTILARMVSPNRHCWLYDTFSGMTEPMPVDVTRGGQVAINKWRILGGKPWMAVPLDDVRQNLKLCGVYDEEKISFVIGDVCDTLVEKVPEKIAVLRLDTDFYESTRASLKYLYPRLVPGGFLIIDDYGHWRGAQQAANEYFRDNRVVWNYLDYSCVMVQKL